MADPKATGAPTPTDLLFDKAAVAESRASQAWFLLTEAMPQIVCAVTPDGTIEYVNPAWVAFSGKDLQETSRAGWRQIVHPDDVGPARECLRGTLTRCAPQEVELRYRAADGSYRWFLSRLAPMVENGRVVRLIGAGMEIEGRRRAEDALRESTALLRAISDTSKDVIYAKDRDGRLRFANPATLALVGRRLEEVLGRTDIEFLDDKAAARQVMENDQRIMGSGAAEELEERVPLPDGTERIWLSLKAPYRDASGDVVGLLGISRDVTERRRGEQALRDSEQRFRSVLENMSEGVMLFDATQNLVYQNAASLRIHGFDPGIEGRIQHDALPSTWDAWDESGRPITFEEWPVSRVFRRERFQNQVLHVRRVETGREFDGSYNGAPILDPEGRIVLGFITIRDITDQVTAKREERRADAALREANERLREADRRKDEFLGMLSHELRNPLAPIRNSSYILRHASPASDQARRAQDVIERQTEHLTRLVDDLLDVTRVSRGKIELRRARVDLRDVVSHATDDFRVMMHDRGVRFDVGIPDEKVWADADATRVTQVIGNLLHNASKFTRRGDAVTLALEVKDGAAEIRVLDTGAGMDSKLLPTIFDPFVQGERTLARTEGGLGLGLALVKSITELHDGTVHAESAGKGKGSEFRVRLPLATAVEEQRPAPREERRQAGRRVLIVDDNRDAAESLADIVRMLGHSPEVAFDGPTALEKARANPPGVVLCDLGLPGMSGYEVAQALRATRDGGMQLIAVSGYAQPEDVERAIDAGFDGHVAKPCDPEKIARLLE